MDQYIITITRQFGSMGRPIAKRLSEILEIEYYDRDIVEETSKKMNLPVSEISAEEEKSSPGFFKMGFPLGMGSSDKQVEIFGEQTKIIRNLAEKGSCIIVGRCSDYILENYKNCMNVFIYAPYEARLRNCVDFLDMKLEEAKKMIASVDKARDAYHKNFAKYMPGDYRHKEILIDSSVLGIEGTAEILADFIKRKFVGL